MKKKILFTLVDLNVGGVQKTLLNILNNIDYKMYDIDVMLIKKNNSLISMLPKEVNVLYVSDYVDIADKKSFINRINKNISIKGIIKKYKNKFNLKYDVAIAFNGFNNYADFIAYAVNAQKKAIWVHNDFYNVIKNSKYKFLYNVMYKLMGKKFAYFDNIVVVCDDVAKTFNNLYKNEYNDKTIVINNYIDDIEIIEKSKEKNKVKFGGEFNIVSTGRLCKAKNFELLINIHKKLIDNGYSIKSYIIGDGEKKDSLTELIKKYDLEDSFSLLGKHTNPYSIMKKADLYISSSLYESFGNTIIESLILGVPVVSTNTLGAKNIVKNIAEKNTCFIAKDEEELYNLIVKQIENKSKIEPLNLKDYNKKVMNSIYKLLS